MTGVGVGGEAALIFVLSRPAIGSPPPIFIAESDGNVLTGVSGFNISSSSEDESEESGSFLTKTLGPAIDRSSLPSVKPAEEKEISDKVEGPESDGSDESDDVCGVQRGGGLDRSTRGATLMALGEEGFGGLILDLKTRD